MSLEATYDCQVDAFNIGHAAIQVDVVEIYPGINFGLDSNYVLVGVEVWAQARQVLGPAIIEPLLNGSEFCTVTLDGSLVDLDARVRPAYGTGYMDYLDVWPDWADDNHPEALRVLETLRSGIAALLEQVKDGAVTG